MCPVSREMMSINFFAKGSEASRVKLGFQFFTQNNINHIVYYCCLRVYSLVLTKEILTYLLIPTAVCVSLREVYV